MSFTIRPIKDDECFARLTKMLHRAYEEHAKNGMRYLASYQDESKTRERCTEGHTLIAELEGKVVGTITINFPNQSFNIPWYERVGVTSFHQFAIDPDFQGTGIGSKLLDAAEKLAKGEGLAELAFDTSEKAVGLISYYEKRGYRLVDECKWEHTNYKSLIYSKSL